MPGAGGKEDTMGKLTCGFIGLGLIGGSIAKALKASEPEIEITAWDTNRETLLLAKEQGIADRTADSINAAFSDCDYLFLCAPVQKNDVNLSAVKHFLKPGSILTDVGSVKTPIHRAVRSAGLEHCFIGGHPMAGSERTGFVNSRASLLENAYYILTPSPSVPEEKLEAYRSLTVKMGAIPLVLDCRTHDYVTAAISHLPHVIAASLVNLIQEADSRDGIMKMIAAGGFKDLTRIASSSAAMWQQICLTNRDNLSLLMSKYRESLQNFQNDLDNGKKDAVFDRFESARIYRDSFIGASSGPIKRSYRISVEIADKSGALAKITALLAGQEISIKNIGISHNRESDDGVLKLEFYDEQSMNRGTEILTDAGYGLTAGA